MIGGSRLGIAPVGNALRSAARQRHDRPPGVRNGLRTSCDAAPKACGQTVAQYAVSAVSRPSLGRRARCKRCAA
jgi:hypothetical protein